MKRKTRTLKTKDLLFRKNAIKYVVCGGFTASEIYPAKTIFFTGHPEEAYTRFEYIEAGQHIFAPDNYENLMNIMALRLPILNHMDGKTFYKHENS